MNGKNETSQQTHSSKQLNVAANKLNDIPAALQEVKKHLGGAAAENIMERIKMAERKKKKQNNDVERASHKQKSENKLKLAAQTEETMLETGNPLMLTALSHIPLESLSDIETKLVYIDEDKIFLEFDELMVPSSTQTECHDSAQTHALNTPDSSTLPHINKQLQMALLEASTCYKQKNYAAAVEQLSTAMEPKMATGSVWKSIIVHMRKNKPSSEKPPPDTNGFLFSSYESKSWVFYGKKVFLPA